MFIDRPVMRYLSLGFFSLQSLWIAVSFRYPGIFDESYHYGVIKYFTTVISPVVTSQPAYMDEYQNLAYGNASLYHYLLSMPLRLFELFEFGTTTKIILLRVMNVAMVAVGLWLFAKTFDSLGIKKAFSNLMIVLYAFLPLSLLVASTISYDNLAFALTGVMMFYGVRLQVKNPKIWIDAAIFLMAALALSLVKFSMLPLSFAAILYLGIVLFMDRKKLRPIAVHSRPNWRLVMLAAGTVVIATLFVLRYVVSEIKYGSVLPECNVVLTDARCRAGNLYAVEEATYGTRNDRPAEPPQQYALSWAKTVLLQLDTTAVTQKDTNKLLIGSAMPLNALFLSLGVWIGAAGILLAWHRLPKNRAVYFVLTASVFYVAAVFAFNAMSYYRVHQEINTQARYLLPVVPVFMVYAISSISMLLGKNTRLKMTLLAGLLIVMAQGGGVVKPMINSQPEWYFNNSPMTPVNDVLRENLKKVVIERGLL
jgi:hypothetical protein